MPVGARAWFKAVLEYDEAARLYHRLQKEGPAGVALRGSWCGQTVDGFYDELGRSSAEWQRVVKQVYKIAGECRMPDPAREAYRKRPLPDWMPGA